MREGEASSKGLSPVVIIGAIIGLFAVIGVGFYIQQTISASAPVNVVVLKAENTSFKEKPKEQAASDDAGNRSSVMVMLDDMTKNKDDIEIISLNPESPEMPEVTIDSASESETTDTTAPKTNEDTAVETANDSDVASVNKDDEGADDKGANTAISNETQPLKRPITPLVSKNAPTKGPSIMVQLAAFRNQDKAEEVAALLTQKHKERLQGLSLGIMQADTGASGVFWRVTTEALPAEDATDLCNALKRAGQDCIFRKVAVQ